MIAGIGGSPTRHRLGAHMHHSQEMALEHFVSLSTSPRGTYVEMLELVFCIRVESVMLGGAASVDGRGFNVYGGFCRGYSAGSPLVSRP